MASGSSSSPRSVCLEREPETNVRAGSAHRGRAASLFASVLLISTVVLPAGTARAASLETLRGFAEGLEKAGAHGQAALEFRRMLFFSGTRMDSLAARWGLWRNLGASGSPGSLRDANAQAQLLLALETDPERRAMLEWESLASLARLGEPDLAREKAYAMLDSAPGARAAPLLRFLVALEIEESQPEAAIRWADRLAAICPASAPALRDSLPKLLGRNPPKSPGLAMILSGLVPGLGQLYAGEAGGAANGLALNGLTGYGLFHGFELGRPAEIVLYLALFQRFYMGGIKVAGARAEDANVAAAKAEKLQALKWAASACTEPMAVAIPPSRASYP